MRLQPIIAFLWTTLLMGVCIILFPLDEITEVGDTEAWIIRMGSLLTAAAFVGVLAYQAHKRGVDLPLTESPALARFFKISLWGGVFGPLTFIAGFYWLFSDQMGKAFLAFALVAAVGHISDRITPIEIAMRKQGFLGGPPSGVDR